MKRIFILLGHTDKATLSGAFADTYERVAQEAGHEVRRMNIGEMQFDPILHEGYKTIQQLEPDLKTFQENMRWCEHFVLLYPTWWSSMPAMLKGLFDRAWLPAFAFRFAHHGLTWSKLLKGRTAHIITSANTPPWLLWFMYGPPTVVPELALMRFAGIRAKSTVFGPSERASKTRVAHWFRKIERLARKGN
ncbi:MAG TPA: NAD(P)H-dependent oxidoreductase [Candidatus Paceibacterota bacterium]|nr:NAD(P)H-dependent oxidoreductase [Candidatus Paceibacterota bacterium]